MIISTGLAVLFAGCGELDMVFPSQGTYRVNALVDGDHTLDEYAVLHHTSRIRPFFINSVTNDPDIRGLVVFVQDLRGNTVSRKIQYLISNEDAVKDQWGQEPPAEPAGEFPPEPAPPGDSPAELPAPASAGELPVNPADTEMPAGLPPESPVFPGSSGSFAESPAPEFPTETDSNDILGGAWEIPAEFAEDEKSSPDTAGADRGDVPETGISGSRGEGETPAELPAPGESAEKNGDPAYTAETKAQDSPKAPAAPPVNPPKTEQSTVIREYKDQIIPVKNLDQYLPAFRIFEDIEIGQYHLVFQVFGDEGILYRGFKSIYFLSNANFTLGEIQSYLPTASTGNRLIPPGINVVLETEISADERLDPYITWQYGKKIIAQGRNSDGFYSILWKAPEQAGFHNIRVEVFPLLPGDRVPSTLSGKSKSLSLPVSLKTQGIKNFDETSGNFNNWYQLWGNLEDAKAPGETDKQLQPLGGQKNRWTPHNGIYGLFIGPENAYTLPGAPLKLSAEEFGRGNILLRLAPLGDGTILHISFAMGSPPAETGSSGESLPGKAELNLSVREDTLVLGLSSERGPSEAPEESPPADTMPLGELGLSEGAAYISVSVYFEISPDRFNAKMSLGDPASETALISLPLANPLTGDSTVRLGAREKSETGVKTTRLTGSGTAILNELALSFTRTRNETSGEAAEGNISPP